MNKVIELYRSGCSIPDISAIVERSQSTVRRRLIKDGVIRGRKEAVRLAATQGKLGGGMRGRRRVFSKEHRENIAKAKLGTGVGVSYKASGYVVFTTGEDSHRGVHCVVMEGYIGRKLQAGECVHHRNGNRSDNRIENLQLMTRAAHARLHAMENHSNRSRNKKGQFV